MRKLPSRLRRLDDALADLPLEEPMLVTELDGFLTGIVVCPDVVTPDEWLRNVWGADEGDVPPFDDPADVQWFVDAVMARHDAIVRDLDRGKPRPVFDIDERNGDVLWEPWADGFAQAMDVRPESWTPLAGGEDPDAADALSRMTTLIAVARNESELDSMQINALQDHAPHDLVDAVLRLHAARLRRGAVARSVPAAARPIRPGRNEACHCGSGKKFKRCCGR